MTLAYANISVELREVDLKNKPPAMLAISPKGTVPVLQLADGAVLEESLDIMHWALDCSDTEGWLEANPSRTEELILENDGPFKERLDRYKYFTRFPEQPRKHYREQGLVFLSKLENCLTENNGEGLMRDSTTLADIAIFPFVRQFAGADSKWFDTAPLPQLRRWLNVQASSQRFKSAMKKYAVWQADDQPVVEQWR